MDCRIVDLSAFFGEVVLLKLAEFPKCGKLECSVIGKHVITVGRSCGARKSLPSDITFYRKIHYLTREFRVKLHAKTDITRIAKR